MKTRYLFTVLGCIMALALLITSCAPAAMTSGLATTTSTSVAATSMSVVVPTSTPPAATTNAPAKPTGNLTAAVTEFGNENFLPWLGSSGAAALDLLVYDCLIYWDEPNQKFIPGLAESWEVSPDALTLTYHLRKGIQFTDGWGDFTSEDVKYNFEMQASPKSVGKTSDTRNIVSMDTPDPYTLVVHFKNAAPTFFMNISLGGGGICQGIVSKKYVTTVGEEAASQKPIGTGPYRMVEGQIGSYYKFEALDSNWRVVPEFKNVTVRCVPELSTTVAMLKNKEIDMARVTAEQLPDLKASGVATEISTVGGNTLCATWGGILIKEDNRYNPDYHNKDPWTDMRVRKAMTISIDREAICKAIFAGGAFPVGAPLMHPDQKNFQYPYNPTEAKKLLAEAGYPNGFSFKFISYTIPGVPETQRVVEAMAGYWQQIGLDPKITTTDFGRYASLRQQAKMAGEINLIKINQIADMMDRVGGQLMPGSWGPLFEDEASYTLYKEASVKTNAEERIASIAKFNQYYFDNYGPLPIAITAFCFAWNSEKIASFPQAASSSPLYLEYFRHAEPLNTFRLFTPWPGR